MRAITIDAPDTQPGLRDDLPAPTPAENEVVVRVLASSVNPVDHSIAAGCSPRWASNTSTPSRSAATTPAPSRKSAPTSRSTSRATRSSDSCSTPTRPPATAPGPN